MQWKHVVRATQDGHKMVFEGLDCLLGQVATMVMGGDKLQLHLVEHDGCLHFS
jgi:hypothetical protein